MDTKNRRIYRVSRNQGFPLATLSTHSNPHANLPETGDLAPGFIFGKVKILVEADTQAAYSVGMNKNTSEAKASVTETIRADGAIYVTATSGKVSAMVAVDQWGVRVICQNASHRCWRGAGRFFQDIASAVAGYKTAEMKAIILAADSLNH